MFRVLLPTGELTLSTRIEFLKSTVDSESKRLYLRRLENGCSLTEANCVFVHLKSPQTSSRGMLINNISLVNISSIKDTLLVEGYYDFSSLSYSSPHKEGGRYYLYFSEEEFNNLLVKDFSEDFWDEFM